jgi:DNA topoisomerase-1
MEDNGVEVGHHNGMDSDEHQNGVTNGHSNGNSNHSSKHKHKDKKGERRKETEEERAIRKEKERKEKGSSKRPETEEERAIRKEKEKKERDNRHKSSSGKRPETEEERAIRKEKERKEKEARYQKEGKRPETEEERAIRKEKERKAKAGEGKRPETEEERRIRKEKDKSRGKETEDERRERKDRERREKKEREKIKEEVKEEPMDSQESQDDSQDDIKVEVKEEDNFIDDDEEEMPIQKKSKSRKRQSYKEEPASDDGDEDFKAEPDSEEEPAPKPKKSKKRKKSESDEEEDFKPAKKSKKPPPKKQPIKQEVPKSKNKSKIKQEAPSPTKKGGKVKKEEEKVEVWKWWEEDGNDKKKDDGSKWYFLEHQGPLFAPAYEPLPETVRFFYNGKKMRLSEDTEEVASFYGRMLDHDYTTKEAFNKNFFGCWRKVMNEKEKENIRDLSKCDFSEMNTYWKSYSQARKDRSKEEKKAEKLKNEELVAHYGFCTIDGHKEKIGNFRIEPPGLFRGRGEHPKQGMLKTRVMPEHVIINCSKDSDYPEPPEGHKWKEVRHDPNVTWLASWTENIQNQIKYVMLNPSSKLKGEKDMMKYEKARMLKGKIDKIRADYVESFKSKEMRVRQRAVAMYFIDKLALRAGNEKDEEQADTVGCCSLRVEHITLHKEKDGKECVVEFDFLGKDSIRYHNEVAVEKRVYKNLTLFKEGKKDGDDLFDRLNTSILNEYLSQLMPGLTAKVFRTYNASITLQEQLKALTDEDDNLAAKVLSYNRANRAVAILCNHQRAVPKTHDKSTQALQEKVELKREAVAKSEKEFKAAKKAAKGGGSKAELDKKKKAVERMMEQLNKLETQAVDKEENKTIALGTSKLNYLDPRITVAWCKKFEVPLEKVYTKTHRDKFRWAIEMVQGSDEEYEF